MSYGEEIDRLTAERDYWKGRAKESWAREDASGTYAIAAERDRARDLAAHLEEELALVNAVYEATVYTSGQQQAEINRLRERIVSRS